MKLIKPSTAYAQSLESALKEFIQHEVNGFWCIGGTPETINRYLENIQNMEEAKSTLLGEKVKASTFWLIDNNEFIGHVNVRHNIPGKLAEIGGHIGYAIRPSKYGQGYGTKILKLSLEEAKKIGLEKILITCDEDNLASRKIIEKNGGEFIQKIKIEGEKVLHFEINP